VLWNDMGWPVDADLDAVLRHFYGTVEDGVVNDRWFNFATPTQAVPHDFRTFEYERPAEPPAENWELTRALGRSFGYDAGEDSTDLLDGGQLIDLLCGVVAQGGNLLLNIGPDGVGRIPEMQRRPVRELGRWLTVYGEAIRRTRRRPVPTVRTSTGLTARFTENDEHVYAIVPASQDRGELVIPDLRPPDVAAAHLIGTGERAEWTADADAVRLRLPAVRTGDRHPYVIALRREWSDQTCTSPCRR
jgi:alpha-L-fucosidase